MKRIFTLLVATGLVTLLQAQPGNRRPVPPGHQTSPVYERNDNSFFDNDDRVTVNLSFDRDEFYGSNRSYNERKRDMIIQKINRVYDQRIQRVRNNDWLSRREKQRKINILQDQRRDEINMVYATYNKRNVYDRRYDRRPNRF